ncbi:MAG: type I glyceraldehyde-3-phosphate dehydrogenase [Candidatus Pacebacteria bacterium]|nr:type I glyceraldehyde-3-phosphate dehydrogenase [Candidatus Paceibacterota bacterium]
MMTKIAINGFGRIGRPALKVILDKHPNLEVVAVNDLTDTKTLSHLLQYDSNYGKYEKEVTFDEEHIIVDEKRIKVFAQRDPELLPWKELGVEVVLECTGFFTDETGAGKHLKAGAKKVVISAPCKGGNIKTLILGVNEFDYDSSKDDIVSNGSCTTNCLAPVVRVLNDNLGIEKGLMTTIHSYTNDQKILDLPHKDLRRARAAAVSMIPTTTGAATAVAEAIPELKDKLNGMAMRVPTSTVSIVDFTVVVKRETTVEEVNALFQKASDEDTLGVLNATNEPLVSVDYKGNPFSSIVDLPLTKVDGNLVKVLAWYDNEFGYTNRFVEMAEFVGKGL